MIADTAVDFLKHYQLVDQAKVDGYARAFVCEDDDYRGNINPRVSDKESLASFITQIHIIILEICNCK